MSTATNGDNPAETTPPNGSAAKGDPPDPAAPPTQADDAPPPTTSEDTNPNAEAARYRTKLRDTEAERDALASRITAMQLRECEAAVTDLLEVPADLWDLGKAEPAAFYTDDGLLNDAELRAAAGALVEQRPGLAKTNRPSGRPSWGQTSGPGPAGGVGWSQVIGSV